MSLREVPKVRTTPEHAGPRVVGCSGYTLRARFNEDPSSVPYVYRAGRRLWVSTPKLHVAIHGIDAGPWTDCQGCFALGVEEAS